MNQNNNYNKEIENQIYLLINQNNNYRKEIDKLNEEVNNLKSKTTQIYLICLFLIFVIALVMKAIVI